MFVARPRGRVLGDPVLLRLNGDARELSEASPAGAAKAGYCAMTRDLQQIQVVGNSRMSRGFGSR
jgi:hypothetical protein